MRFLPILLCAALIAASCNSSLSGAKAPSGQMPAIRYGVLEDYAAGMEMSDVESLESYDDVLIEYALFDYRQKLLENPGAEFYDCAAADFPERLKIMNRIVPASRRIAPR